MPEDPVKPEDTRPQNKVFTEEGGIDPQWMRWIQGGINQAPGFVPAQKFAESYSPQQTVMDEGPPAEKEAPAPSLGLHSGSRRVATSIDTSEGMKHVSPFEAEKGTGKADAFLVGQVSKPLTPEQQAQSDYADFKIQEAEALQGYAFLQGRRATVSELEDFAQVAAYNAGAMHKLVSDNFAKFQQRVNDFEDELEEIKSMRVNPYQYLQNAGGGGRVGAVLATAVSQIAAGAGQIAPAHSAIKSAIERDISAQISNIDIAFKGLEAGRKLLETDKQLIIDEIAARERALATHWTATQTIITAAMGAAQNEASRIGLQALHHYATAERMAAILAKNAKEATIIYKMPLRNAASAIRAQGRQQMYAGLMNKAAGWGAQQGYSMAQRKQQNAQFEAQAASMPATTGKTQATAKPSVSARRPATQPIGMDNSGVPEKLLRPELRADQTTTEDAQQWWEKRNRVEGATKDYKQKYEDTITAGGPDRMKALDKLGKYEDTKTFADAAHTLINNPDKFFDKDENYRTLSLTQAADLAKYQWDVKGKNLPESPLKKTLRYIRDNPEMLEGDTVFGEEGGEFTRPTVYAGSFGRIKLSAEGRTPEEKELVAKSVVEMSQKVDGLTSTAKKIRDVGLTKSAFLAKGPDDPISKAFRNPMLEADLQEMEEELTRRGVEWIKTQDPSGRLSDQDVKLALRMVAAIRESKTARVKDVISRIMGKDTSAPAEGMALFLERMAIRAERKFIQEHKDLITISREKLMELERRDKENIRAFTQRAEKYGQ